MTASFRGFGVLAHAEFRKLFTAYSTSAVGDGLQLFALTFVVLRIGGGPAQLALVLAARQFPTVALTLLSGVWADRLERRRLLVFSDLVCGSCQLAVAAVVLTGCAQVWHLALLGLVFGSARSLFVPAVAGLVPATVPADQLRQANSLMQTVRASTYVAGAPIAAFVISISSPGVAVLLDGISFVISAAFLAAMRQRAAAGAATPNRGMWRELRGGWHEVRSRRWLLAELLRSCIDLPLVIAPMTVLGPIIAAHRLGGVSAWAMISTAFLVGTLAGPVLAHRSRPARPMLVCTALMYIGAVSPLLLAYSRWAWPIAASELVKGVWWANSVRSGRRCCNRRWRTTSAHG